MRQLGLGILFRWRQENADVPTKVEGSLGKVSGSAREAKASFVALGVALAGLAVGIFSVGVSAGEFQRDMARVANISGATASEMEDLRDAAIDAGIATQFSPREAAAGLTALASAGFDAEKSIALLNSSLALSAAGQIPVEQGASTLATVLRGYSLEASDAARVTDLLVNASSRAKLQINELNQGLGKTIKGATLTGQSFEEMITALGIAKNTMVDVSTAGNSISRGLTTMANKSDLIKSKIGVNVLNAQGQFKDWLDLVVEVGEGAEKSFSDVAKRTQFLNKAVGQFGLESFATTLAQIRKFASDQGVTLEEAVIQMRAKFQDADGVAERFVDGLNDTMAGSITLLGGTMETLAIVIGEPIANILKPVIQGLTAALNVLLRAFNELPGPVKTMVGGLLVGVAVIAGIGAAAIATTAAITLLTPSIVAATVAMGSFLVAAAPILLIIAAIGAAIALLVIGVQENFGGLGDLWDATFGRAILLTRALIQLFSGGELSGSVLEELNKVENSGVKQFAITLFQIGFRIKRFFEGLIQGVVETLGPPLKRLGSALSKLGSALWRVFSPIFDIFTRIGRALGIVSKKGAEAAAKTPSSSFFETAVKIVRVFGTALGFVLDLVVFSIEAIVFVIELVVDVFEAMIGWLDDLGVFEGIAKFLVFSFEAVKFVIVEIIDLAKEAIRLGKIALDSAEIDDTLDVFLAFAAPGLFQARNVVDENQIEKIFSGEIGLNEAQRIIEQKEPLSTDTTGTPDEGEPFLAPITRALEQLAEQGQRPVIVQTPSGEVLFETVEQGQAESQARTFDVTSAPL